MSALRRLQQWFLDQCDDTWEHQYGIKIDTLDNPGWSVQVDLTATALEGKHFEPVKLNRSESDWIQCFVRQRKFNGAGGALNLDEILSTFLDWAGY